VASRRKTGHVHISCVQYKCAIFSVKCTKHCYQIATDVHMCVYLNTVCSVPAHITTIVHAIVIISIASKSLEVKLRGDTTEIFPPRNCTRNIVEQSMIYITLVVSKMYAK